MTLPLPAPIVIGGDGQLDPTSVQQDFDGIAAQFPLAASTTYFRQVPQARVFNSANINVPNNAFTALTFDSETFDNDTIHSTVTNPSRLTARTPGLYSIVGDVSWATNGAGVRALDILLNGVTIIARVDAVPPAANDISMVLPTIWRLAASDYVELRAYQNSGGGLNAQTNAHPYTPMFAMSWISS